MGRFRSLSFPGNGYRLGGNNTLRLPNMLNLGMGIGMRKRGRPVGSKNKKGARAYAGLTNQYDKKTIYRKRRMPRRRRRRWVRFARKTNAVVRKDLGTQSFVRSTTTTLTIAAGSATAQTSASATLYGFAGFGGDADDMVQLDTASSESNFNKVLMCSAVLDVTFTNNGSTTLELDVYYVICRKDVPAALYDSINGTFTSTFTKQQTLPGIGVTALLSTTRGVTPFQNSIFCSYWKVIRKTKYILTGGQTGTYQLRDPKDWVYNVDMHNNRTATRGRTKGLLFVMKSTPDNSASASSLALGTIRTYSYKILSNNAEAGGLL